VKKVTTLQITHYHLHISLSENEAIIPYLFVSGNTGPHQNKKRK
jgi:hypothetical protein